MLKSIKEINRSLRDNRKKKRLASFMHSYDKAPTPNIALEEAKSIALLRWDNKLGDSIMSTVLIANLEKHRPDIQVTVITQDFCADWFRKTTNANIITVENRSLKTAKSLRAYKNQFDVLVEMGSNFDFKELVALHELSASYNIGYNKDPYNIFNICINKQACHFYDRYLEVAKLFTSQELTSNIPLISFPKEKIIETLPNKNNIAINLFGSSKYRQFNEKQALLLLKRWITNFPNDYLYLVPVPDKVSLLKSIVNKINDNRVKLISSAPSLEHTLQLMSQVDFCLTPDTSVVHLSSALNSPIIAIYSDNKANFNEWKPLSSNSEVIFNSPRRKKSSRTYVSDFNWDELVAKRNRLLRNIKD